MTEIEEPLPLGGLYLFCPECKESAERIRLGIGTARPDGTPQDRYRCRECDREFEGDAYVKAKPSQATFGDAFKQ